MIYITKDTTNTVVLELNATNPFSPPAYLFVFTPEWVLDGSPRYFTTYDIATFPVRASEFLLVESATGSTGQFVDATPINLDAGQYRYEIYGTTGPINFATSPAPDPILLENLIETGRMFVDNMNSSPTGAPNNVYS